MRAGTAAISGKGSLAISLRASLPNCRQESGSRREAMKVENKHRRRAAIRWKETAPPLALYVATKLINATPNKRAWIPKETGGPAMQSRAATAARMSAMPPARTAIVRSEEHTSELQ